MSDLTLLDNLDFVINFPVSSLLPFGPLDKDDIPEFQLSKKQCSVKNSDSIGVPSRKSPKDYQSNLPLAKLIENCLREKEGGMIVSDIYQELSTFYPKTFDVKNDKWKNTVRHTLSVQPQFKKGPKIQGKNHIWYLDYNVLEEKYARFRNMTNKVPSKQYSEQYASIDSLLPRSENCNFIELNQPFTEIDVVTSAQDNMLNSFPSTSNNVTGNNFSSVQKTTLIDILTSTPNDISTAKLTVVPDNSLILNDTNPIQNIKKEFNNEILDEYNFNNGDSSYFGTEDNENIFSDVENNFSLTTFENDWYAGDCSLTEFDNSTSEDSSIDHVVMTMSENEIQLLKNLVNQSCLANKY